MKDETNNNANTLEGWKEAAIAWTICASIHAKFAKNKDAFFSTRQADFIRHADEARAKALNEPQD